MDACGKVWTLNSTWNTHACTLFSHSKNNMWRHVENIKHKLQKIHSQIPCDTIFHMKYTYLHINSTQQELHVDVCEKIWTYTAENPQLNPMWHYIPGLGSSTVDQVLKYTKYPKYIPSTSTGQVLIFLKKYLSTSSTFISSTSTCTSTHIKICSKVRMDIQSRVNFGWKK